MRWTKKAKTPAKKPKPIKDKPTSFALAKMRREYGGTWQMTFAVEGYDQLFEVHAGITLTRTFAVACGIDHVHARLGVHRKYIHLNEIKRA